MIDTLGPDIATAYSPWEDANKTANEVRSLSKVLLLLVRQRPESFVDGMLSLP